MEINGSKVIRTYRAHDWTRRYPHVVHITEDRRMWDDVGEDRCSDLGPLPKEVKLSDRRAVLDAANQ
jgi:hypothetical protein